ncbi:MAG: serine/threonine-protein phosphatase [Gammaproteobacteria bacterium]|nr:serine/threonine-protein phosphatase [Gammaproteobacteria bacterium]
MDCYAAQIQGARPTQEDAYLLEAVGQGRLALLADGLGGHPAGEVASREALAEFRRAFAGQVQDPDGPGRALKAALMAADRHLHDLQRRDPATAGMATTLVALYLEDDEAAALSVGDSYLLLLRDSELVQLNEMHSEGGVITSCVGFRLEQVDLGEHWKLRRGDRFVLASDGLLALTESEITRLLANAESAEAAVTGLLAAVRERGDPQQDNATLVAVFV